MLRCLPILTAVACFSTACTEVDSNPDSPIRKRADLGSRSVSPGGSENGRSEIAQKVTGIEKAYEFQLDPVFGGGEVFKVLPIDRKDVFALVYPKSGLSFVNIYKSSSGELVSSFELKDMYLVTAELSGDQNSIWVGSRGGRILEVDIKNGKILNDLPQENRRGSGWLHQLLLSPSKKKLLTIRDDKYIGTPYFIVRDTSNLELKAEVFARTHHAKICGSRLFRKHGSSSVSMMQFSEDGLEYPIESSSGFSYRSSSLENFTCGSSGKYLSIADYKEGVKTYDIHQNRWSSSYVPPYQRETVAVGASSDDRLLAHVFEDQRGAGLDVLSQPELQELVHIRSENSGWKARSVSFLNNNKIVLIEYEGRRFEVFRLKWE